MLQTALFQDLHIAAFLPKIPTGLNAICFAPPVTADAGWVAEYVKAVRRLPTDSGQVLASVEVSIHDLAGRTRLPAGMRGLDLIHLTVDAVPGPDGPMATADVRSLLRLGAWTPADVIALLVEAQLGAMTRLPGGVLAHPFSVLTSLGLSEADVSDASIAALAAGAVSSATSIEVSEHWHAPGPRIVAGLLDGGVKIVAGSGASQPADVGRYRFVTSTLRRADALILSMAG